MGECQRSAPKVRPLGECEKCESVGMGAVSTEGQTADECEKCENVRMKAVSTEGQTADECVKCESVGMKAVSAGGQILEFFSSVDFDFKTLNFFI